MAFRYRFRPDVSQLPGFERHCADARFVWNLALRPLGEHGKDMLRSARGTVEPPGRNVAAKAGLNRRIAASACDHLDAGNREAAA